jgi:signal transduction histidine kinase
LERLAALGGRAAEVAHELRNALSVLETSLHLARRALKASPESAKAEPHLARMGEQIHAGQSIVREVLDEARDSIELAPVDLRSLVLEVIGGVTRPEHLSIDADVARVRVVIDARQVRQLLINLVRNAIEALAPSRSTPRPGTIRILGALASSGSVLQLCVEDDGPGIDAAIAPRLFQPFATGKRGGTGLGLALCRRIAEAHGGAICAEPITPRGTRMKVTLPLPVPAKPPSESRRMAIR